MVTESAVWDALAEIPDPEIPVISLVDLGVIRDVAVDAQRVRIEFTPTFLGCPALEELRPLVDRRNGGSPELKALWEEMTSVRRSQPAGTTW